MLLCWPLCSALGTTSASVSGLYALYAVSRLIAPFYRDQEGAEAGHLPGVPSSGEDCHFSQCGHVSAQPIFSPSNCKAAPDLTTETSSYRFKLPSQQHILGLPIGQHISIGAHLPQPDGTVKEIVRSYTPISGDHQPGFIDLLIKSYPQGNISKHMASLLVGQAIRIRGPKGAFVYTPNMVRHFGMIAGGTGITPMLQVIRAIIRGRATGDKTEVDLIFANVTAQDILLKEDLDALAKEDSGFRVHYVLDKPPEGWTGGVGFVTADMITVRLLPRSL